MLALVLAVPVLDVMTGSRLSLSAAFGYSPTGNSRLYGISNYSFGMVAAAACLLAVVPRRCAGPGVGDRRRAIGLLGGGAGRDRRCRSSARTWAASSPSRRRSSCSRRMVTGYRVRVRTVVVGLLVTVAAVTAFGLLDLARPEGQRAHLGRLFERVGNEGLEPLLSIMERKAAGQPAASPRARSGWRRSRWRWRSWCS